MSGFLKTATTAAVILGAAALGTTSADATLYHHHAHRHHTASRGVTQRLVSDGDGTGFGFYHEPLPLRRAAWADRARQEDAVDEAVMDDAATSGGYWGFPGDSVYGEGNQAVYGVFDGADGFGTPFFAGYYGQGYGKDYGVFGRAYN